MKIAHIAPIHHLYITHAGDFDFALAHIARDNPDYLNFFKQRAAQGRTVFLDNGVWEMGKPIDSDILLDIAKDMSPSYVYAPDYLNESDKTVDSTTEFMNLMVTRECKTKIIAVAQGNTLDDWTKCTERLCQLPVDMIALPALDISDKYQNGLIYPYGKRLTYSRLLLCAKLSIIVEKYSHKQFYATGFGSSSCAYELRNYPWIWGVDTTMACLLASEGRRVSDDPSYKPNTKLNFEKEYSYQELDLVYQNIDILNHWAR